MKLFLKGILLYTTIILSILYILAIDSIIDSYNLIITTSILAILITVNTKVINKQEFNKLTLK